LDISNALIPVWLLLIAEVVTIAENTIGFWSGGDAAVNAACRLWSVGQQETKKASAVRLLLTKFLALGG